MEGYKLRKSEKEAAWYRQWKKMGERIFQFPDWMQKILLEDINTAIENRIAIFEMIQKKVVGER